MIYQIYNGVKKLNFLSTIFIILIIFTPPLLQVIHPDLIGERGLGGEVFSQCNAWTQKADFGGSARQRAVSFSIGSKGYIGTGRDGAAIVKNDFWEYNTINNTWTQKANFGGTARQRAVGFSIGSKGYIGTGENTAYLKDFWEYDTLGNFWTQLADFGGTARSMAFGFSIANNGYVGAGLSGVKWKDFWKYDTTNNSWTQLSDFGGTGRTDAIAFSIGNKGFAGLGHDGNWKKDFWEYDLGSDTWTPKSDFGGMPRCCAAAFSIGNKGFVGTGWDDGVYRDFWEYDTTSNTWTQKANFGGIERASAQGFSVGSKGYIGTGSITKDFWEYNPQADILPEICLITVDSTSTKNVIVWEKPVSTVIDSFRIYRNIVGVYTHIGSVAYNALSDFTDNTPGINPDNTSYKYEISALDTCGNESVLSDFHKTIHLQISLGIPPAINLSWDDYIGFTSWYYRILRDSTGMGNWELKDSVDSGTLSWTDPTPPQTPDLSYLVEAVLPAGCTATLMKKGKNYNTSKSNKANKQATGIQDSEVFKTLEVLNVYPNPFTSKTQISYNLTQRAQVLLEVYNILGKKVQTLINEVQNDGMYQLHYSAKDLGYGGGVAILKLRVNDTIITRKLLFSK